MSGLSANRVARADVREDPDAAQIGDLIELRSAVEHQAGRCAARQHDAVGRGHDLDAVGDFAGMRYFLQLQPGHAHVQQLVDPLLDVQRRERSGLGFHRPVCGGLPRAVGGAEAEDVGLDDVDHGRRRENGQHLVFLHAIADCRRRDLANDAVDPRIEPVDPGLAGHDPAEQAQRMGAGGFFRCAHPHADALLPDRVDGGSARGRRRLTGGGLVRVDRLHVHAAGRDAGLVGGVRRIHGVHVVEHLPAARRGRWGRPPRAVPGACLERHGKKDQEEQCGSSDSFHMAGLALSLSEAQTR
ncbi:MAG: hypothetical protein MUE48_13075 [Desulfobacterales bacterium]|nr:hypothetical protein [Desulfobacterales bacterium]